jgi:hypothetical protein
LLQRGQLEEFGLIRRRDANAARFIGFRTTIWSSDHHVGKNTPMRPARGFAVSALTGVDRALIASLETPFFQHLLAKRVCFRCVRLWDIAAPTTRAMSKIGSITSSIFRHRGWDTVIFPLPR